MPLVPLIDGWETVAEMEAALGIPEGNLAATLDRYNTLRRDAARTPTSTSSRNSLRRKTKAHGARSTCHWARRCMPDSPWAGWHVG